MTVGIYVRVSTTEQAQEGYSIPAQKERLKAFCVAQGWKDYKFYIDDGISGRDMERPKLKLLLKHVEEGKINVVLVYRLDRFTRSVRDLHKMLELLNENNCGFKSATEVYDTTTAMGRLFITIVAALAEWESDNSSERIKMALEEKVAGGERVGGIPYGFDLSEEERLVKNDKSIVILDIIEKIKHGMSANQIANFLNKTNMDKINWSPHGVLRILRNPALYGATRWNDKVFENTHEGLISKDEFTKLQNILEDRTLVHRRDVIGIYLFQGVVACPVCGRMLSCNRYIRQKKDGSEHVGVTYKCQACYKEGRGMLTIGEQRFLDALKDYMKIVDIKDIVPIKEESSDLKLLKEQLKQIESKREKYQRGWAADLIKDNEFEKLMNETEGIYEEIKEKINKHNPPVSIDTEALKKIVFSFNQNFDFLTHKEKWMFISRFIKKIEFNLIPMPPKRPDKSKKGMDLVVISRVLFY